MLNQIHIRDLATIEELHLNLHRGCTMITGETGAGKSIFIEAIELALGGRASPNIIRPGKEKTDISLCFDINTFPKVRQCLENLDLQQDSPECIIRRVIMNNGRSSYYVNGTPVTSQLVKELGELLFHLHGQHEQHVLLHADTQREMLDRYGDHFPLATQVKKLADEWRITNQNIVNLREKHHEHSVRRDYLLFQLDELNRLNLQVGEWELLEAEHHRLTHAEELLKNIQQVIEQLSNDDNANIISMLYDVRKTLESIQTIESKAAIWMNNLNSALIQLNDLESDLQNYLESVDLDPEKLQQIEERISSVYDLSRKHKLNPHELIQFKEQLTCELNSLHTADEDCKVLEIQLKTIEKDYQLLADELSINRKKAATKLECEITDIMRSLSLPYCDFKIELEEHTVLWSPYGKEKILFLIKTNPDQQLQSIAKAISGGELSRLSLAVHLALAHRTSIPTLVFDEVDTGLSGATAKKIGNLLRKLGDSYQVFCVTHQPQVAACGHHHLLVEKNFIQKTTHTGLRLLTAEEKTKEVARMLGGEKITTKTLEHAKEILEGI